MKRTVPLLIATTTGFVMVVAYFIPATQGWGNTATSWFNILAAAALVLGGGNLLKVNLERMWERGPGWGYAAITAAAFVVTLVVGLLKVGVHPLEQYPDYAWSGEFLQEGGGLWWEYEFIIQPVTATMFSMLAFFVASAAFRAFRAKNLVSVLLLSTALIVLLGRTYAGVVLLGWLPERLSFLRLDVVTDAIMATFNTAGTRAIKIGIALGIVATSLKVLLGIDRPYLGGGGDD